MPRRPGSACAPCDRDGGRVVSKRPRKTGMPEDMAKDGEESVQKLTDKYSKKSRRAARRQGERDHDRVIRSHAIGSGPELRFTEKPSDFSLAAFFVGKTNTHRQAPRNRAECRRRSGRTDKPGPGVQGTGVFGNPRVPSHRSFRSRLRNAGTEIRRPKSAGYESSGEQSSSSTRKDRLLPGGHPFRRRVRLADSP